MFETASPGEPLVMSAGRNIEVHIYSHLFQLGGHLFGSEVLLTATAHEEIFHLGVEFVGIGKHSIKTGLHVNTKESPAECTEIGKLVEMRQDYIEGLKASP